jgi:Protein of unknown function (DUF3108)
MNVHPSPLSLLASLALLGSAVLLSASAQAQPLTPTPTTAGFTLPTQLRAQYSGVGQYGKIPLSGTGVITWKTKSEGAAQQYEAGLEIGALFYKSTVLSQGTVNAQGIHPLRTEEKNTGRAATVITVDTKNKLATVTGKDSPLPFDAAGQDLLTVIAQLGTYVQTQPQWRTAGEQKTFAVYRPGGLKSLRFQSQGMQNVMVNGVAVPTVHVIQVPVDAALEPDDQHQFWLDPARHGFPVKLRKVKSDGAYVELTLKDWQEH